MEIQMSVRKISLVISLTIILLLPSCLVSRVQQSISVTPIPAPSSNIQITDFVTNLDIPWGMAFSPDGRIFVTERKGKILLINNGQLQADPWITLDVAAVGEGGLLGLALDPGFSNNHYLYVAYTYRDTSNNLKNQLVRLREDTAAGKGVMDKVILDNAGGGGNHDGGRVKFGPDGKIYWTLGETNNPPLAQDLTSLNGKILRLNPDGTIPADNPFPNSYVYSYGHRNPQGLAWQPGTNRLCSTEHGPSGGFSGGGQDEVNYIQPGQNYGWPDSHGDTVQPGTVGPIIQSGSETWAPSGCTFVSGGPWNGSFLFAGLAGQSLYRLILDPTDPTKVPSMERLYSQQYGRLRDVIQGPDGAIYILTNNTDGRGSPKSGDDRILKLTFE
jgi:aldose sugar dehydrogenase